MRFGLQSCYELKDFRNPRLTNLVSGHMARYCIDETGGANQPGKFVRDVFLQARLGSFNLFNQSRATIKDGYDVFQVGDWLLSPHYPFP